MDPSDPSYCHRNASGTAFLVVSGLTFGVATIIVPLRIWMRVCRKDNTFGLDDVCLIAAYFTLAPALPLTWRMADKGLGKHVGCYSDADLVETYKLEYIAEDLMIFSEMFARASVAFFVTRLFGTTKRLRMFLYGYTAFMALSLTLTGGLLWGICRDTRALWDYHIDPKTAGCKPRLADFVDYYNVAISILTDFMLAMLPSYFLIKLQMKLHHKIALMALMAIGLIPMVCAICRTVYATKQFGGNDPLYTSAIEIVFGTTEATMLVVCATIPALLPLVRSLKITVSQVMSSWHMSLLSSRHSSRPSTVATTETREHSAAVSMEQSTRSF